MGAEILDRLEEIRRGLLMGSIPKDRLQELAHLVREKRERGADPTRWFRACSMRSNSGPKLSWRNLAAGLAKTAQRGVCFRTQRRSPKNKM